MKQSFHTGRNKMKILIYSDLHLEFGAKFETPSEDNGDVLVLPEI